MSEPATIDLTPFCDSESARYALGQPYVRDGWLIATDGTVCARMPDDRENTEGKYPNVASVFDDMPDGPTARIPEWQIVVGGSCPNCGSQGGRGVVYESEISEPCDSCEGSGDAECLSCGQLSECDECEGSGKVFLCPVCAKLDSSTANFNVRAGGLLFSRHRWEAIANLPDVQVIGPMSVDKPVFFAFASGGQAAIMPQKEDDQ